MEQHDIAALNREFGIAGQLEFGQEEGMAVVRIANAHASSSIALQGAHVMSYQAGDEKPLIWMSPVARLTRGKSLRGGIPICWPWFGPHAGDASFPAHGFARTVPWRVAASEALPDGRTRIVLELPQDSIPQDKWPHSCCARYRVTVGKVLETELVTENTGNTAFEISEALHTYFAISDIGNIAIHGMEGCAYLDKVGPTVERVQQGAIRIAAEVDRIYIDTETDVLIEDGGWGRRIRIAKTGSRSNVVWNPWIDKSARMGDFGSAEGYRGMLCVESANAAVNTMTLAPGAGHSLCVVYSTEQF